MWISKYKFEMLNSEVSSNYKELNEKYWNLYKAHQRLLDHFGLTEKLVNRYEFEEKK